MVVALFITYVTFFITFQYQREKEYKVELLNTQLQDFNDRMSDHLSIQDSMNLKVFEQYLSTHRKENLRITIIHRTGTVIYDNVNTHTEALANHLNRKEIKEALTKGSSCSISRRSESTGERYFYSAKYYPKQGFIIRSALPYDIELVEHLKADSHYIWFASIISLLLLGIFYRFTRKLDMSISQLKSFTMKADSNEYNDSYLKANYPKNELGEISNHIFQIYHRLHQTKEYLYIEREKLIKHLQISHEGLGVFTHQKKEILVNNLFTQYMNLISDKNLSCSEEIFSIPELTPISDFILKNQEKDVSEEEKRMSLTIDKGGRIFAIECIIFQDDSFEISVNDNTIEEEKARLKKQLTQNIAHELKTPVSSIQGYLETIINNPSLPQAQIMPFLERSYAQSNRLTHLLRDISALTRMEDAPGLIEKEEVNVGQIMDNILNEVNLQLEERQMKAYNQIPSELHIQANPSLLYSIFRNLTDNAISYAGPGSHITIKCFREDDQFYYFSFADTGVGVKPEHLTRLFERFYRVDKGRSRKLGGTGLGLAIVKNAILIHQGTIFAKPNPEGGLEFIFSLSKE